MGAVHRLSKNPDALAGVAARVEELLVASGVSDPLAAALRLVASLARGASPPNGSPAFDECMRLLAPHAKRDGELAIADALFETMTSRRAKGEKGQFFTPRHVIELAVRLVRPRDGELVLDPAAGSGAFLWHAAAHADVRLVGVEIDPRAAEVARALLSLAAARSPERENLAAARIRVADALRAPLPRADVVLTNPPFAGEIVDAELLARFTVAEGRRRVERDVLFLERAIGALAPGGRIAIVLPHRTLADAALANVRRFLLDRCVVRAVVGLDPSTFMPHTQQRTAVIAAERRRPTRAKARPRARSTEIAFAVSARSGLTSRGVPLRKTADADAWRGLDHDLGEILEGIEAGERARVALVGEDDLDAACTLSPQRWLVCAAPTGALTIGDVATFASSVVRSGTRGYVVDTSDLEAGLVRSDVARRGVAAAGSQKRVIAPGDVIVSRLRPYLRQVAYVDDELPSPLHASTEILALRPREQGDDIAFLAAFLLTAAPQLALAAAVEGGHHPRFRPAAVLAIPLPRAIYEARRRIARELRHAIALRRQSDRALAGVL